MILLIDLGRDMPAFSEQLEALMQLLAATVPISEAASAGVSYRMLHLGGVAQPFSYGYMGDSVFFALGAEAPAKLVAVTQASAPSLARAPAFIAAYADVAGENEQVVFYASASARRPSWGRLA